MIETYRLNHKKNNTTGSIIVLEIKTEEKKKGLSSHFDAEQTAFDRFHHGHYCI